MDTERLSVDDLARFAALGTEIERKDYLRTKLGMKRAHFDDDDMRSACLFDFHYANLEFAIESGLAWQQGLDFVRMMTRVLSESAKANRNLFFAVKAIRDELEAITWDARAKQRASRRIFESFLQHYALYRFVCTREREERRDAIDLSLEGPPTRIPLRDGVAESIWRAREERQAIEKRREEKLREIDEKRAQRVKIASEMKENAFEEMSESQDVATAVAKAISARGNASLELVESNLESAEARLDLIIEQLTASTNKR
ncbi:uncharacterized protein C8orf74 homolog [Oscarella lobularis]|uniref:uncharacterized protein C8orf74 homolog n=1 Tax=Oscarella lobularis TaxID=121494 RepID=UPI0033140812